MWKTVPAVSSSIRVSEVSQPCLYAVVCLFLVLEETGQGPNESLLRLLLVVR